MLDVGLWVASVPVPFVQASMPSLPSAIFTNPDSKERHVYFSDSQHFSISASLVTVNVDTASQMHVHALCNLK
jgi:hypothetical protein